MTGIHLTTAGIIGAVLTVASISATLWWMLHPPKTKADIAAGKAERVCDIAWSTY